jgi:hypothetical protein
VLFLRVQLLPTFYHPTRHPSSPQSPPSSYLSDLIRLPIRLYLCSYSAFNMTTSGSRRAAGVLLLLYGAFSLKVLATTCYSLGGYILVSFNYQPCYTNETGPCCSSGDECLSNGMCFNAGANNLVSQSGCTDPTFSAPGCAIICSGPFRITSYVKADLCECPDYN